MRKGASEIDVLEVLRDQVLAMNRRWQEEDERWTKQMKFQEDLFDVAVKASVEATARMTEMAAKLTSDLFAIQRSQRRVDRARDIVLFSFSTSLALLATGIAIQGIQENHPLWLTALDYVPVVAGLAVTVFLTFRALNVKGVEDKTLQKIEGSPDKSVR